MLHPLTPQSLNLSMMCTNNMEAHTAKFGRHLKPSEILEVYVRILRRGLTTSYLRYTVDGDNTRIKKRHTCIRGVLLIGE